MSETGGLGPAVAFAALLWYASTHGFPWWVEGGLILTFIGVIGFSVKFK